MRRAIAAVTLGFAAASQSAPPATEVYLADLEVSAGRVTIGTPRNISNSPGYDNQPSFTPDGRAVLFTSVRGDHRPDPANSAASGSDIYRYDIGSGRVEQVTNTPEAEYSPTVMPDGRHISVVRVERDGTQRLWRFTMDGVNPQLILPEVRPVGYHAWADAHHVAVFVLGKPATLQLADPRTGESRPLAKDIARALQRMPRGGISFVQRQRATDGSSTLDVMELEVASERITRLVSAVSGATDADHAWTPDGLLLMPHAGKLHGWRRGEERMTVLADLEGLGLHGATRLAVSPAGNRIAIVGLPAATSGNSGASRYR